MRRKKKNPSLKTPFRPCGRCIDGLIRRIHANGRSSMAECPCLRAWRAQQLPRAIDGKPTTANAGQSRCSASPKCLACGNSIGDCKC